MALNLRKDAYMPDALIDAGVPAQVVRRLMADGPAAVPERPRTSIRGRGRGQATTFYVWGPDAMALLTETAQGGSKWL